MPSGANGPRRGGWDAFQQWWRVLKITVLRFYASGSHLMAAAIAFYCLICLGPIGILLAALLQYALRATLMGPEGYRQLEIIAREMAGGAADHVMEIILALSQHPEYLAAAGRFGARAVGLIAVVWAGLHLFDSIQISLARVWVGRPVRSYFLRKAISILMLVTAGLLFVTLVVLLSLRGSTLARLEGLQLLLPMSHGILMFVVGVIASALAYVLLYKFMPARRVNTRAAVVGAIFAAVLWQTISPIFTRMLTYSAQFGSVVGLGWVVIFGWWAFMGAQVMLLGAQMAAAYDHVVITARPRAEDDDFIDALRRRIIGPLGDRDAEAERTVEELGLDRPPAVSALDPATPEVVNGIILAGGRLSHAAAVALGTDVKGLIEIDGHAAVEYVVAAMRRTPGMNQLVLVGDKSAFIHHPVAEQLDGIIDEGPDTWHNLLRALRFLKEDRRVLLASSDTPLLTAEALGAFLKSCDRQADLCYPVTRLQPTRSGFVRRPWVLLPLREGWITHTCNVLFDPRLVVRSQELAERFVSRRKDLWGAAGAIGVAYALRFLLSWHLPFMRYSMDDVASQIQLITGARKCQGVLLDYPEIALDLDRPDDVAEITAFMAREAGRGHWHSSLDATPPTTPN